MYFRRGFNLVSWSGDSSDQNDGMKTSEHEYVPPKGKQATSVKNSTYLNKRSRKII